MHAWRAVATNEQNRKNDVAAHVLPRQKKRKTMYRNTPEIFVFSLFKTLYICLFKQIIYIYANIYMHIYS